MRGCSQPGALCDCSLPSAARSLLPLAPDPDMLVSERSCHNGLWIHESHLHGRRSSMLKVSRRQGRLKTLPLRAQGFLAVSLTCRCHVNWSWDLTAQFQINKSTKSCLKSLLLQTSMSYWVKAPLKYPHLASQLSEAISAFQMNVVSTFACREWYC